MTKKEEKIVVIGVCLSTGHARSEFSGNLKAYAKKRKNWVYD